MLTVTLTVLTFKRQQSTTTKTITTTTTTVDFYLQKSVANSSAAPHSGKVSWSLYDVTDKDVKTRIKKT